MTNIHLIMPQTINCPTVTHLINMQGMCEKWTLWYKAGTRCPQSVSLNNSTSNVCVTQNSRWKDSRLQRTRGDISGVFEKLRSQIWEGIVFLYLLLNFCPFYEPWNWQLSSTPRQVFYAEYPHHLVKNALSKGAISHCVKDLPLHYPYGSQLC